MTRIQSLISGATGAIFVPVFHFLYGEGTVKYLGMTLYLMLILMDWAAGYRASKKDGSYASEYGIDGGFRTLFLLAVPAAGHLIDRIIGMPMIAFGFLTVAFALHIWKSMTANAIRAGWDKWVPTWAMNAVSDEIEHKLARAIKRRQEKDKYLEGDSNDGSSI